MKKFNIIFGSLSCLWVFLRETKCVKKKYQQYKRVGAVQPGEEKAPG